MSIVDLSVKNPPHWANDKIAKWEDVREDFVVSKYWCGNGSVNVFRVIGTSHPDYSGMTWKEFLQKGKRMTLNLDLHSKNRAYYLDTIVKQPGMYYLTNDGLNYFVGNDGNHRTCIARFDYHYHGLTTIHGVNITDLRIDREMGKLFTELDEVVRERRINARVAPDRHVLGREDTGGWMLEKYEIRIRFLDDYKYEQSVYPTETEQRKS